MLLSSFLVFSFHSSPFFHCVLYHPSPTPSIFCCYSLFSHSFEISLLMRSLSFLFFIATFSPPFSGHLLSLPIYISYYFSPFQPTHHQFLLKTFLHSNLHSQFAYSSLICSLRSHDSSCPDVLANLHFRLLFLR